ncbi:MAG: cytidine deaminase [Longicatena sp.]
MSQENEYKDIIDAAFSAMEHAYAPYSNYHVGACVKLKNGKLIVGVNVENASYGLTNCAERSAIFATYSLGYTKEDIVALCIVSDGEKLAYPCGACRQVLVELLNGDTPIVLSNRKDFKVTNIMELLPMSFTKEDVL